METICSSCGKVLAARDVLYAADARTVCAGCQGQAELAPAANRGGWYGLISAGLIAGALPFVLSISSSSYREVGGVVHATYRDWIAIGGGAIAILLGIAGSIAALRRAPRWWLALGGVALVLGGLQLARGVGAFEVSPAAAGVAAPAPTAPQAAAPQDPARCADPDACDKLASQLARIDPKAALAARMRSCELGQKYSCYEAAQAWEEGAAADPKQAQALYQKACDLGHADGCADAGIAYLDGEIVAKDLARARALAAKACDGGSAVGCKNLAVVYRDGLGVPVDLGKTFELVARACDGGHFDLSVADQIAETCASAGFMLVEGRGTERDPAKAVGYFERACDRAPRSCFNLGVATADGIGGRRKDPAAARALYAKACDAGSLEACHNLGELLRLGRGGAKDPKAARQLFEKACDGGVHLSCENLQRK